MSSIYDKSSLVLIPSGTKTGKVFSQKPTNGDGDFTFTRASAATRVNADGNIEKETQNLLTKSNTLSAWSNSNTTETGGQSGYDGSSDAWLVTKSNSNAFIGISASYSGVFTQSVYAKAGSLNWVALQNSGISQTLTWFDLQNGVTGSAQSSVISHSITDVGNGWYRCEVTYNGSSSTFRIFPSVSDNNTSGTSGNIYIQDAQLEQGLVARDYIETTTSAVYGGITDNVPRLDYTDSSCPALLLEPQRQNHIAYSEYFGAWAKYGSITITDNYGISPEGVQNSARIQFSGASEEVRTSATSITGCMASIYVKGTNGKTIKFGSTAAEALFTLNGDWQRINLINAANAANMTINTYSGATARDIEVYGAQVESNGAGGGSSYATSYIPTYGSSVSRVVDSCLGAGDASTFNSTEGVLFWEGSFDSTSTPAGAIALIGAGSNRVQLYNSGTSLVVLIGVNGISVFGASTNGTIDITSNHKYAVKWGLNDFAFWIDGVEYATDTSGATFSSNVLTELRFTDFGTNYLYANTKQVLTFNTALTDTELATLTTI